MSNAIGNSSTFSCNGKGTVIKCNLKTEYGKQQVPVDFCQLGKGKQVQILYDLVTVSMEYISTAFCGAGHWVTGKTAFVC